MYSPGRPGPYRAALQRARALGAGAARITDAALGTLIGEYCREAGVRALKKQLEKIYRKVALRLVKRGASAKVPPSRRSDASSAPACRCLSLQVPQPAVISATRPARTASTGCGAGLRAAQLAVGGAARGRPAVMPATLPARKAGELEGPCEAVGHI